MSISQIQARRERFKLAESTIPLAVANLKGKVTKTPSSKSLKKKKKTKASNKRARKKAKLLGSAISAIGATKVYFKICLLMYLYASIQNSKLSLH